MKMSTAKTEKTANIDKAQDKNIVPGKLIILSGPSASGKSTVLKELFKLSEYKYSVSATTRSPREGETDGIDYYFMTKEDFFKKLLDGAMLEHVEYPEKSGNYYGTLKEPVKRMLDEGYNVVLEIEVIGAISVKREFPEAIMIFISPPTFSDLEERLRSRGTETEESINKRLARAKKEIRYIDKYDYLVINRPGMQKISAYTINCITEAEKHKVIRENAHEFIKEYFFR